MTFADYYCGPLEDVADALNGDNPPTDPKILAAVLARVVAELVSLKAKAIKP